MPPSVLSVCEHKGTLKEHLPGAALPSNEHSRFLVMHSWRGSAHSGNKYQASKMWSIQLCVFEPEEALKYAGALEEAISYVKGTKSEHFQPLDLPMNLIQG